MGTYKRKYTFSFNARDFGRHFKAIRFGQKYSLREVSAMTGVDIDTISRVERGKIQFSGSVFSLSIWADIDLRNYAIRRQEEDPDQPHLPAPRF